MIRSNELREGNKVISTTHNLLNATVQNIMPHSGIVTLREVSTYDTFDKLEPIPLTPEHLVGCGFELFPWGWVKKSSQEFGIRLQVKSFSYEVSGNSPVKLHHVHQLQNLFFALTGVELQIKNI